MGFNKIPSCNSLWGHAPPKPSYKGLCLPLEPQALLSYRRKEAKDCRGDPGPPLRGNWYARKISLRGSPRLEREIFPLTRMPSRGCKESIFLGSHPRQRGLFKGGRTSTVPRVVRPPLNALLVKAFSHKKPCAGCRGAQRPAKPGGASAHKPRFR